MTDEEFNPADSYREIGNLLRLSREELRLSADEVSHMLHIRVRYIRALEEGKLKDLPGLTYTRGYLQSYAMLLGLDKEEIIRRFEQIEAVLMRRGFYFPRVFNSDKSPSPILVWGGLGLAVVTCLTWAVFQPSRNRLPVVERFPEKPAISLENYKDVACFQPQTRLYPPCTAVWPEFDLLPLKPVTSMMELAQPNPDL